MRVGRGRRPDGEPEHVSARPSPAIGRLNGGIDLGGGERARGDADASRGRAIATQRRDGADRQTTAGVVRAMSGVVARNRGPAEERSGRDRDGGALDERGREAQTATAGGQFAQSLGRGPYAARAAGDPTEERLGAHRGGPPQRCARAIQKTTHRVLIDPERARGFVVGLARNRGEDDRLTLHRRQSGDVGHRVAYRDPAVELVFGQGTDGAGHRVAEFDVPLGGTPYGV